MARPIKTGLDYGNLDVNWNTGEMEYITCKYGMIGAAVIKLSIEPRIWENGYYLKYGDKSSLTFSNIFGSHLDILSEDRPNKLPRWEMYDEIVKYAVEVGYFEPDIFKKYGVLTSKELQKFYVKCKEKSPRVEMERCYLLLKDAEIPVNVEIIEVSEEKTYVSTTKNTIKKSKGKKSKEEYSKVEERNDTAAESTTAVLHKYEQLIGIVTPAVIEGIDFFISQGMESSLIIRLIEYACEQGRRSWLYIQASLRGNMDAGIKTLDAYKRAQAERAENAKKVKSAENKQKNKFNNYTDTNKPDYSDFGKKIIEGMLRESEVQG